MDAESVVVQYEDKIKKLLEKFLEPNFEIRNDTYLNTLLSHLSGKDNKDLGEILINLPIFTDWLFKATQYWEETDTLPSTDVSLFTMYLASMLSKNETRFIALNSCNVYVRLILTLRVRMPGHSMSIKMAYNKLLSSFLQHKSGTEWLIATNNWQDVLADCLLHDQDDVLMNDAHNFMYALLVNSSKYNKVFCNMIIEKIMVVFDDMHFTNGTTMSEANYNLLRTKLTPTLRLISYTLESCLQSESFAKRDYAIPGIFLKNCHLEQNVWNIIMIGIQNEEFLYDLNKVMILNYFFGLAIDSETELFDYNELKRMIDNIYKLIKMHLAQNSVDNILKICYLLHRYWKLISSRLPNPQINCDGEKSPMLIGNQIVIFQLLPSLAISFTVCNLNLELACEDVFRDHFVMKLFATMCEHTLRLAYNFRTIVCNEEDIFGNAQRSIVYIMKSRKYYQRNMGVIVFQSLMYVLKDVKEIIEKSPEILDVFTKNHTYFTAHLNTLATFIKEFDITWRESVETICVMSASVDILSFPNWSSELIVQALKLINISIERFMTPNLALLVDRTSDSSMAALGPILIDKLQNPNWVVRDSALEVLHTISNIAHTKFPSFQNTVLEFDLPAVTVSLSMYDNESRVRASAIRCLQEMIKVQIFWKHTLEHQQLYQKIIHILYNEPEANVRSEAASLMCCLYEYQQFHPSIMDDINEAMLRAATLDLHWEVRSKSLCYWNKAIINRLVNQGMIDGTFPSVTFSKEQRKIITLTESEIKNRLNRVLLELSNCGCLHVLITAMEDNELEVATKAVAITKKLTELLNLYTITSSCSTPSPKAVMDTFNLVNTSPMFYSNGIIKAEPFSPSVNEIKTESYIVPPKEFLDYIQKDLEQLISERTRWRNEADKFSCILDEIIKNEAEDVNAMEFC